MNAAPLPHPPHAAVSHPWLAVIALPLVVATDSVLHAVMIAAVSLATLVLLQASARVFQRVSAAIRSCIVLIIAAGMITSADLLLSAYVYELHASVPLLASAVFAAAIVHTLCLQGDTQVRPPVLVAELVLSLIALGTAREIVGHGSLLHDAHDVASITLFPPEMGFFLAALAPGAFIALGLWLALRQWWQARRHSHEP